MCYVKFIQYVVKSEKIVYKYRSSYWRVYGQVIISEHKRGEKEAFMVDERWQGWCVCLFMFFFSYCWFMKIKCRQVNDNTNQRNKKKLYIFCVYFIFHIFFWNDANSFLQRHFYGWVVTGGLAERGAQNNS